MKEDKETKVNPGDETPLTENAGNSSKHHHDGEHHHHHHDGEHHHHHDSESGHHHHHTGSSTGSGQTKRKSVKTSRKDTSPIKKELAVLVAALAVIAVAFFLLKKNDSKAADPKVLESMSQAVRESVSDESLYEKWNMAAETTEASAPALEFNGKRYREKKDLKTMLLIGLDVNDLSERVDKMSNRQQADFLLLVGMNDTEKNGWVLHINRDTMADVMTKDVKGNNIGTLYQQICLSHNYGVDETDACENTVKAVSDLLYGAHVDHYICTTMDSVRYLNDAVGGVTLTCLDGFPFDSELQAGATVTLIGDKALKYVRARMEMPDDTNLRRMARQDQYLTELRKRCVLKSREDSAFLVNSILSLSDSILSDCRINELSDIANAAVEYDFGDILTIQGDNVQGEVYMEYYADEESLQQQVIDLFYEEVR